MTVTKNTSNKIAFVILAAGESRRMGKIKQLLMWQKKSFIKHSIDKAQACCPNDVFVVLGANSDAIFTTIKDENVHVILNPNWKNGLGSSISSAVNYIDNSNTNYSGILISLVDQVLIPISHFENLLFNFNKQSKSIVVSKFNKGTGVPAIFSKPYFTELSNLIEDYGAKRIIAKNVKNVFPVKYEGDYSDIDTPDDYLYFLKRNPE